MNLSDVAEQYGNRFLEKYRQCLLPSQVKALKAIQYCRTAASGMTLLECNNCVLWRGSINDRCMIYCSK